MLHVRPYHPGGRAQFIGMAAICDVDETQKSFFTTRPPLDRRLLFAASIHDEVSK